MATSLAESGGVDSYFFPGFRLARSARKRASSRSLGRPVARLFFQRPNNAHDNAQAGAERRGYPLRSRRLLSCAMGFANVFGVGRVSTLAQSMCNLNALLRRESEILANVPAIGCPKTSAFSNDSLHKINLADRNRAGNADRRGLGFGVSSKKRHTPTERRGYSYWRRSAVPACSSGRSLSTGTCFISVRASSIRSFAARTAA